MSDKLIPIKGSVFVNVQPPESIKQVAEAQSQSRAWVKVANAIGVESVVDTPSPIESPKSAESIQPKMTAEGHQNSRFLNKIYASLAILGGWKTADRVFSGYYNKYNHANVRDIEIGLDKLVDAGRVETKSEKSGRKVYRGIEKKQPVIEGEALGKKLTGLLKDVDAYLIAGAQREVSK